MRASDNVIIIIVCTDLIILPKVQGSLLVPVDALVLVHSSALVSSALFVRYIRPFLASILCYLQSVQ